MILDQVLLASYYVIKEVQASPWAFGWTAVAALASGVLALVTTALALSTRSLAKATSQDVRSAWRPVLIGAATGQDGTSELIVEPTPIAPGKATLRLFISNLGSGPALNIKITASSFGHVEQVPTMPIERGTLGPGPENQHQLVVIENQALPRTNDDMPFGYRFELIYEDVSGVVYHTTLTYEKRAGQPPFGPYNNGAFRLPLGETLTPEADTMVRRSRNSCDTHA